MMLIATSVAVALFASTAFAAGAKAPASSSAILPMIVNVTATPEVSPVLVARILAEADAIWRPSGVTFVWQRAARVVVPYSRASETGPYVPNTLRLIIGDNRGARRDGRLPLGWILFDDVAAPEQEIYLSHTNALQMMAEARGVVGIIEQMPIVQRETLLARAMGRALAHELGHYLLASKVHAERGLMKAILTAAELFSPDSGRFRIEPAQRRVIAARLRGELVVASRQILR
jgi:hypothetical protein